MDPFWDLVLDTTDRLVPQLADADRRRRRLQFVDGSTADLSTLEQHLEATVPVAQWSTVIEHHLRTLLDANRRIAGREPPTWAEAAHRIRCRLGPPFAVGADQPAVRPQYVVDGAAFITVIDSQLIARWATTWPAVASEAQANADRDPPRLHDDIEPLTLAGHRWSVTALTGGPYTSGWLFSPRFSSLIPSPSLVAVLDHQSLLATRPIGRPLTERRIRTVTDHLRSSTPAPLCVILFRPNRPLTIVDPGTRPPP